jgi:hypothetical protein
MSVRGLWSKHVFVVVLMASLLPCIAAPGVEVSASDEGLYVQDPMVKISSLPIDKDVDKVLAAISKDVSRGTGIEQQYVTYYWQTLDNINCMGKKTTDRPILVDLYVPGFFTNEIIGTLMTSLAMSIEEHVGLSRKWVFIQVHFPNQGQVYLSGGIQIWDDYKGPENAAEYTKTKNRRERKGNE